LDFILPPEHARYIFHHIKKTEENWRRGMRTDASSRRRTAEEKEEKRRSWWRGRAIGWEQRKRGREKKRGRGRDQVGRKERGVKGA
jgi:hypothetical protein